MLQAYPTSGHGVSTILATGGGGIGVAMRDRPNRNPGAVRYGE
jgi:hypothetical protein